MFVYTFDKHYCKLSRESKRCEYVKNVAMVLKQVTTRFFLIQLCAKYQLCQNFISC